MKQVEGYIERKSMLYPTENVNLQEDLFGHGVKMKANTQTKCISVLYSKILVLNFN